jgi:hypothetical protein
MELRRRVRDGRELGYASFEPIYYLVFPPHEIINVKRHTPAWIASLPNRSTTSSRTILSEMFGSRLIEILRWNGPERTSRSQTL